MHVVTTVRELRRALGAGGGCVLVPTMGALHRGHLSLIEFGVRLARKRVLAGGCVVSIFVNPTQFNERGDFDRYPRSIESDALLCEQGGASLVFAPAEGEVYPAGESVEVPALPRAATEPGLEDAARPGHFAGVCQVVLRLFRLIEPRAAIFGEKDWQQYQVVRAMTRDLAAATEVAGVRTVREPDGLAMSSRNRFLSGDERERGLSLVRGLRAAAECGSVFHAEHALRAELLKAGVTPDYAVVRDAESLLDLYPGRPGRALVAARVGSVRLLDNAPWPGRWW